jgi:hypothetical protein
VGKKYPWREAELMKRILALVEGQTEETFVRDILKPYLLSREKIIIPKIATTKRTKSGPHFKGGVTKYSKIKNDIRLLLNDSDAVAITTILDYYGLPADFPGKEALPEGDCYKRVICMQNSFKQDINNNRFIPFFTLHEFEAFLFTSPGIIADAFPDMSVLKELEEITGHNRSPEEINNGQETHPSARLAKLIPEYRKALHGPIIVNRIGLDTIRHKCGHFSEWLVALENL